VIDAVRGTIRRHAMLAGGERVLVAVSGGADSVALLHTLRRLAPDLRLWLSVLHVDHGLRPEAGADAEFVDALCRAWAVPVRVARVTVTARGSVEAAARAARYAALSREAARISADRIAVGHTADDQAETVLMRILQGAGLRGLAGIPPRRGRIIRPLIEIRHADIVAELESVGSAWRQDASNRDPRFLRARLRHQLIPHLCATYNPAVVDGLVRVATLLRPLVDQIEARASFELAAAAAAGRSEIVLPRARLRELPDAVGAEVLRLAAARLGHEAPLRAWAHRGIERMLRPARGRRQLRLGGVIVESSGDQLRLAREPAPRLTPCALRIPGVTPLAPTELALEARHVARERDYAVPHDPRCAAFDADALTGDLGVRPRRSGDEFVPFGETRPRRLKSLLIAAGIPRWERDRVPLVVASDAIVWVAGVRRSHLAPVTGNTRRVLELSLVATRGAEPGGRQDDPRPDPVWPDS
jgi:tRNA(Ile)-lysidine synthase